MSSEKRKNIQLVALAFLVMTVFGFTLNIKGTCIPSIKRDFDISYGSIGIMIFFTDIAYMLATFLAGIAGEKYGLKNLFQFGIITVIVAIVAIYFVNSFPLFILPMFFITVGMGCFEIGLNSIGAQVFVKNAAVMMNLLHLFYGVGSTAGPKYAGMILATGFSWRHVYLYSLIVLVLILLLVFITPFPKVKEERNRVKIPFKELVNNKKIWLFAAVLGLCIVSELAIGNWLVNFLQVIHSMDENSGSIYLSFFFIAFTIGRLVGGFMAEKLGYVKTLLYFTISYIVFFSGGLTFGRGGTFLFSLTGLSVSIMYPTLMTIIMKEFRNDTTVVMGFIITASSIFNMLASWLIGKTSDMYGVFTGFTSVLIYIGILVVLLLALGKIVTYDKQVQAKDISRQVVQ